MQFVVMDLEWNTAYSKRLMKYINEIIEVGAVKLDENMEVISTYSKLINPQIDKKLRNRVKILTHLTNDDITTGEDFLTVVKSFFDWAKGGDTVFLSWGNMDLRVMFENFKYFNSINDIYFIKQYADIQRYCMECLKLSKAQQLGLNSAAELLRIDLEEFVLHRALTDSEISAKCFKKLYDKDRLEPHIQNCSEDFYKKMFFKPYIISDVNDPLIDKSAMQCKCIRCGKSAKKIDGWRFLGGQFRAIYLCRSCNVKMMANVQFKKYYDKVSTKKSVTEIDKKKPENRRSS